MNILKNRLQQQAHYNGFEYEIATEWGTHIGYNKYRLEIHGTEYLYSFICFIPLKIARDEIKKLDFRFIN